MASGSEPCRNMQQLDNHVGMDHTQDKRGSKEQGNTAELMNIP
jgi:hypothetical protein